MSEGRTFIRCAIYTRTSSEEGLDQTFNSLHAQREACESYIKSQVSEGWRLVPRRYDDGGHSGGSIDRPALRDLLADVSARRVDTVVVYKVDRLTRSLSDFARLIEAFEDGGVSFVSVTQAFNTTSSMGRLTLNVLLSFAQFEREVTGERIRDKIAASKAKGMWMGGRVPLGYDAPSDPAARTLVVNVVEAKTVRIIFNRFLEFGNTLTLQRWLSEEGIRSKEWTTKTGRHVVGMKFSRGALRYLLQNRIYLGEIAHRGLVHPGRHTAILERSTFEAVQALIAKSGRDRRLRVTQAERCLLNGLIFDMDGQPMIPKFGQRHSRYRRPKRYEYYVSARLLGPDRVDGRDDAIRRLPCAAIDELVIERVSQMLGPLDETSVRTRVRSVIGRVEIHSASVHLVVRIKALPAPSSVKAAVQMIRAHLAPGEQVLIDPSNAGLLRILLPTRLVIRGGHSWAIGPDGLSVPVAPKADAALINQLREAHTILEECDLAPEVSNRWKMLRAAAPKSSRQMKLVGMAFLAPQIQRAVLAGELAMTPQFSRLLTGSMTLSWSKQISALGLRASR